MIPRIQFTSSEYQSQTIQTPNLEKAVKLFRVKGCLLLENVFPTDFISALHTSYLESYQHYFQQAEFEDGLTVGEQRYKISVAFELPFNSPLLYANPFILSITRRLLDDEMVLTSFASVTSLPGSPEQQPHRDHPRLFGNVVDRLIPSYAIKLIIPLIDLDEMSGTTRVWPGSQLVFDKKALAMDVVEPPLSLGDCMLMDYRLLHQGTANRSEQVRPILFLGYARPWFKDQENFKKQPRLKISRQAYQHIPKAHRYLFSGLEKQSDEDWFY